MKKIEVENLNEEESLSEDILKISEMYWKDYLESLNLNTDIEKMCEICIQDQITQHGAQVIKCKGRLNAKTQLGEELYEELKSVMTPSEFDNLEAAYSPYEFMNRKCDVKNIGKDNRLFKHRWYQQQALECVHEDTLIAMGDGTTKKIKDIVVGDKVLSYNETRCTVPTNKVLNKWNKGVRPVYRITLENSDHIEVTDNHPILAHFKDGLINTKYDCKSFKLAYKSIREGLDVGMDVYTLNQNVKWGDYDNLEVAKLLGYLVTDGYINLKKSKIQFANIRKEYVDEVVSIVKNTFDCSVNYKEIEAYTDKNNISRKHTYDAHVTNASKLKDFLKSINCIDKSTKEESILTFALNNFSESAMRVFINRAYAGDGCVYNYESGTSTISFAGRISDFIPKWRELLRKIGIWSPRVYTKTKLNNSGMTCCFSRTDDIIRFFNFVGEIYGKEKQSKLSLENALKRTHNIKKRGRFKTTTRTKIKSIEYIGEKPVYDIEVENRHNFIANNIIVHNCSSKTKVVRMGRRCGKTFALASTIVATALTDLGSKGTGHRILLVSPFQNQTEEVIETIKIICRSFDVDPIESSKASPVHIIKFKNGSIIKGFTAGIDGNSIRGQPADSMYLDEYDDMPVKAITSISAVVMDNPDVKIWLSGTPKGELNLFKEAQNLNSKEFYYPSYVIPHYSDDMDFEMRSKLDEIGYLQECLIGDTLVRTESGSKPIRTLTVGDKVYDENLKTIPVIQNARLTGLKEVFKYKTINPDVTVTCTNNHSFTDRLMLKREIKDLKELEVYYNPTYKNNSKEEIMARLIGYNLGDGTVASTRFVSQFYSKAEEDMQPLIKDIYTLYPEYKAKIKSDTTNKNKNTEAIVKKETERYTVECSVNITHDFIKYGAVRGKKVEQIFDIPFFVINGTEKVKAEFVAALFGAEGCLSFEKSGKIKQPTLVMTKKNNTDGNNFFTSLVKILKDLQVDSTYTVSDKSGIKGNNKYYTSFSYVLTINNSIDNLINFFKNVGVRYCRRKEKKAFIILNYLYLYKYYLTIAEKNKLEVIKLKLEGKTETFISKHLEINSKSVVNKYAIKNTSKIQRMPSYLNFPNILEFIENYVTDKESIFLPIIDCKSQGVKEVYNVGVGSPAHNYLLDNGIHTFNCMALYGVTSDNIYQILFIKRATEKQYYLSPMDYFSNRANYISILGVDWNHDQVGTRLVLVAYDKTLQQFYILDKARVSLEGWTQQKAMEKIIEFNRRYNIDHIFVDAGFGATQIGDLRLYGELQINKVPKGHPDLKLMDVQPVDFGSNVEIKDPHSGETFKQGLKQFAVQNSVLILEKDMLTLHPEEDKDIIAQMKNYIQKSRNKGRVTYGYVSKKVGDHDLDALVIALFGFKKLYSSTLGDNIHQVMMRFSSPKNEDGSEIVKEEIDYSAHRVQLRFGSKKGLAKYSQRVVKLNRESRRRSY